MGPLAERCRVLAIDCLNWGPGDVFDQEFSFAYLVDHVREFMDAMGIEKANIVGHSMGGWIATLMGYESPGPHQQARPGRRRRHGHAPAAEHGRVQGAEHGEITQPDRPARQDRRRIGMDGEHIMQTYLDKAARRSRARRSPRS